MNSGSSVETACLMGTFFQHVNVFSAYILCNSYGVTINLPSNKLVQENSKIEQSVWDDMVCKHKASTLSALLMSSLINTGQATLHPQNK